MTDMKAHKIRVCCNLMDKWLKHASWKQQEKYLIRQGVCPFCESKIELVEEKNETK